MKHPDDDVKGLTERINAPSNTVQKDRLWAELMPKLRRIAQNRINNAGLRGRERPTEVINDLYPGLQRAIDNPKKNFASRGHFLAYAAQAMRRMVSGIASRPLADELLDDNFALPTASPALKIALDQALKALAVRHPRAVYAWQLREHSGYSHDEIMEKMAGHYRTKASLASDLTLVRKALVDYLRTET